MSLLEITECFTRYLILLGLGKIVFYKDLQANA